MTDIEFSGFSQQTLDFYKNLADNNSKTWFEAHRNDFDRHVMEPARQFVTDMGRKLREMSPDVVADPRVNKSIFRIFRDVRFSKDKTPYKTNLALAFWEGQLKKLENSCYYFHLEADKLMLGAGIYQFTKPALETYRQSVIHDEQGAALAKAIEEVRAKGYSIGQVGYKKIPRGFDKNHPRAELLLYNGLTTGIEMTIPDTFYSADFLDFCLAYYRAMAPIHTWLLKMNTRIDSD